MSLSPAGGLYS